MEIKYLKKSEIPTGRTAFAQMIVDFRMSDKEAFEIIPTDDENINSLYYKAKNHISGRKYTDVNAIKVNGRVFVIKVD